MSDINAGLVAIAYKACATLDKAERADDMLQATFAALDMLDELDRISALEKANE